MSDLRSVLAGFHIWFVREGDAFTVPAPGIAAQESKPGIEPDFDAAWIEMGTVEGFEPTVSQTDIKLYKPSPGRTVLKDLLETKQELGAKVVVNDLSALAFELVFRTSQALGGAQQQFNPLSAVSRKGWAHIQGYDNDDNILCTMDWWVRARATVKFALGEPVKPEVELFWLYSSLSTG